MPKYIDIEIFLLYFPKKIIIKKH